jgi:acyl transferase domain-containing protein/acyl carrier protein
MTPGPIAIVGMAGRFPGSANLSEFWKNLLENKEGIHRLSPEELAAVGIAENQMADPNYVPAAATLADIDLFDAAFFDISAFEAALMDPQHRLFLELAWGALEHAGYAPNRVDRPVGVFAGASDSTYYLENIRGNGRVAASTDGIAIAIANGKDYVSSRVAYHLDLKGPAVTVQTACSTSLVAVHLACRSLLDMECDMALAGGASITTMKARGYRYVEGSVMSADGHCRSFDAHANGTVFGDGAGIVVLKRLDDALRDGDTVHAVVRGSAINNDGIDKQSFAAPSIHGQALAVSEALRVAGLTGSDLSYVEAHGTGTILGDPIEVWALERAFGQADRAQRCMLGSVKANVGHLNTAAGVAGLIKTVLALKHEVIPGTLHFQAPNPRLELESGPFRVSAAATDWRRSDSPRCAGVSSFGIGGTNAHVILEEAPATKVPASTQPFQLIVGSARTASALEKIRQQFADSLDIASNTDLADFAYTSQVGRAQFSHRFALVCATAADASEQLRANGGEHGVVSGARRAVFLFPGQGSQRGGIARELHARLPAFAAAFDHCCALLGEVGAALRDALLAGEADEEGASERLQDTRLTQPALFVFEYALARQLQEWGIVPAAMVGHSIGEFVAACLAGVMSLENALLLVRRRGEVMAAQPAGAMLSVALGRSRVDPLLGEGLWLAADNGPDLCTVSGTFEAITRLEARLDQSGTAHRRLRTSHAFHSGLMDAAAAEFVRCFDGITLQAPAVPYLSNVTGAWVTAAEATDPAYWARQLREPVCFRAALETLAAQSDLLFVEVGAGAALTSLARRAGGAGRAQPLLGEQSNGRARGLLPALARLWCAGVEIDWASVHRHESRRRVALPTYPFERQRYWIDPDGEMAPQRARERSERAQRRPLDEWFYAPIWTRLAEPVALGPAGRHLVLADRSGLAEPIGDALAERQETVLLVESATVFQRLGEGRWAADPHDAEQLERVLREMAQAGGLPARVTHVLGLSPLGSGAGRRPEQSLTSLHALARAWSRLDDVPAAVVTVFTNGVHEVTGAEILQSAHAPIVGGAQVLALELPRLACRHVDIELDGAGIVSPQLARTIAAEATGQGGAGALRGAHRWRQDYERVSCPADAPPLKARGCYLVTGGLGGLGQCFAEYLADREPGATIVLVGRTPEPELGSRRAVLTGLQARGPNFLYLAADIASDEEAERLAGQLAARNIKLDGIFHAAGVANARPLSEADECFIRAELDAKVRGTVNLHRHFAGHALDFFILCSSLRSIVPWPGFGGYGAANAYLDAFAHEQRRNGFNILSVNWGLWKQVGLARSVYDGFADDPRLSEIEAASIDLADAPLLFDRILAAPFAQLAVSPIDFRDALKRERRDEPRPERVPDDQTQDSSQSDIEEVVAAVWQDLFGGVAIDRRSDFFDLGGQSLLATQMLTQLRSIFEIDIPLRSVFDHPTVEELSRQIERLLLEAEETSEQAASL